MRTFAHKQDQPQKSVSTSLARPHLATPEQTHHEHPLLHLQRAIGNQAVLRMLQTHAEEPDVGLITAASPRFGHDFSRIPIHPPAAGALQTKLPINQPRDQYEQEADRITDQILATPMYHTVSGAPPGIQRFSGKSSGQMDEAPASVDQAFANPGRPLEPGLRQDMEQRFGHDFSRVRVHSGAAAEQSARDVNAHAYTVGHNMVFGTGRFVPGTHEGRRLIAHELTHVVQADVAASNPEQGSSSVEALEREAGQVAVAFHSSEVVPPVRGLARGLTAPLREGTDDPGAPTFGNLPQDEPSFTGRSRVELVKGRDGKWSTLVPGSDVGKGLRRTAKGSFVFVVQDGRIWAVKPGSRDLGHTEAAQGGRVTWAGSITFNKDGELTRWTNASGHYLPVGSLEAHVDKIHPDLDYGHYKQTYIGPVVRPVTGMREGPQLPVFQPNKDDTLIPRGRGGDVKRLGSPRAEPVPQKTIVKGEIVSKDKLPPQSATNAPPKATDVKTPQTGKVLGKSSETVGNTARAIAELDAKATRAADFTARIRTYVAAYGVLQHVLSLLDTIEFAQRIYSEGTVFPDEQRDARQVEAQSEKAKSDAEGVAAEQAQYDAILAGGEMVLRGDQQALFVLADSLIELNKKLYVSIKILSDMSTDLDEQAQATLRASNNNKQAATQGTEDAVMAQAATLHISFEKLSGTLRMAAENYKSAAETLSTYSSEINKITSQVVDKGWALARNIAIGRNTPSHSR